MIRTYYLLILCIISIFCAIGLIVLPAGAGEIGEWRAYGSDKASTKYIPLDQINRDNVKDLRIAWRWDSPDNGQLVSRTELPSNAHGAPISYMADSKQFILIPIGGANLPAELIALSLP